MMTTYTHQSQDTNHITLDYLPIFMDSNDKLKTFCEQCDEPIYEEHTFTASLEEDHYPDTPGIPSETIHKPSYTCPKCGYCPTEQ